ncbi:MAG: hypothetical protein F6J86_46400 [Symploca sp. SIO1B1]|nr:hypothetical protein [Symploca sp. SIO1A3]NES01114.1 hypothetical protein [Symploca sp. SIO1B1]
MAQEQLTLTFFKSDTYQQLFNEAGFDYQGISNDRCFVIYKKRSLVSAYLKLKHQIWNEYSAHISTWELEQTLDC